MQGSLCWQTKLQRTTTAFQSMCVSLLPHPHDIAVVLFFCIHTEYQRIECVPLSFTVCSSFSSCNLFKLNRSWPSTWLHTAEPVAQGRTLPPSKGQGSLPKMTVFMSRPGKTDGLKEELEAILFEKSSLN